MITKQELREVLQKYRFEEKQIDRILNKKIKILLKNGNKDKIDTILQILLNNSISRELIEKCLTVLATGKAKEIEDIFKVLKDNEISKKAIERCLYVLATGKAKEIEDIFKVLKDNKISTEAIEGCLTVLATGKAKEIEDIFKVLKDNEISKKAIERCLYVLATGKAKEIEDIFKVLKDNKISTDIIHNNLGFLLLNSLQEIQTIFTEGNVYLKRYMQLKGYYDKVISEAEIQEICKEKKVTEREFFEDIRGKDYLEIYEETVKRKGGIYIGKSFPIDKDYTNDNALKLMDIATKVSRNFGYQYQMIDIPELESQAIEIIISKCGDIVYNLDWNSELLERCIYSKTYNYLKINIIYPILKNNIRIFLELMYVLKGKIKIMKEKGFSKKHIQMILMDERLYSDIKISKGM